MAKKKSIQATSDNFHIPQTPINRWMVDGYFDCDHTQKGNQKGQGRRLTYGKVIDEELITWLLDVRHKYLPISRVILRLDECNILWGKPAISATPTA